MSLCRGGHSAPVLLLALRLVVPSPGVRLSWLPPGFQSRFPGTGASECGAQTAGPEGSRGLCAPHPARPIFHRAHWAFSRSSPFWVAAGW